MAETKELTPEQMKKMDAEAKAKNDERYGRKPEADGEAPKPKTLEEKVEAGETLSTREQQILRQNQTDADRVKGLVGKKITRVRIQNGNLHLFDTDKAEIIIYNPGAIQVNDLRK